MEVIFVLSMPRSGSSFLSQLLSADKNSAVRLSPFFSYSFGDQSRDIKTDVDFGNWVNDLITTEDQFVAQKVDIINGRYPIEPRKREIKNLFIKDTRNIFDYVRMFLRFDSIKILFLDRSVGEQVSSWLRSPEFKNLEFTSRNLMTARQRKSIERYPEDEYWGVQDMFFFKRMSEDLANRYPLRVKRVSYANLVDGDFSKVSSILPEIDIEAIRLRFSELTQSDKSRTSKLDPYSVYRPSGYSPNTLNEDELPADFLHVLLSR